VLLVTSNFPRWDGDTTTPFVLHLAQDLSDMGWLVDVLAPHAPGAQTVETLGGIRVERFRYLWPAAWQTVCYEGGALINLRQQRSNLLKLPPLVIAEWVAIIRRLASGRYDILNTHWILPQGFTGVLAAKPLGIPHVMTVHGGDAFALRGRTLTAFKRFALHHCQAVTVNSSATRKAVTAMASRLKRLHQIPMGVSGQGRAEPLEIAALRAKYRCGGGPLLVFLGRIVEEKGVGDLIRAVSMLSPDLPDTSVIVLGEGQDRSAMEAFADRLGIAQRVTFTGWIEPELVPAYLAAADIFVGPSRTAVDGWVEAQGLTFLEAMLAHTPVIATRIGGITDTVRHEDTGLLVEEAAPDQIATAVKRLLCDAGLAARLCQNAERLVRRQFTRDTSARAFSALFQSLLQDKERASGSPPGSLLSTWPERTDTAGKRHE
jgi:glycosyltransferase involved in cell wall biosynthesis